MNENWENRLSASMEWNDFLNTKKDKLVLNAKRHQEERIQQHKKLVKMNLTDFNYVTNLTLRRKKILDV
jgi:hypothetical protein